MVVPHPSAAQFQGWAKPGWHSGSGTLLPAVHAQADASQACGMPSKHGLATPASSHTQVVAFQPQLSPGAQAGSGGGFEQLLVTHG